VTFWKLGKLTNLIYYSQSVVLSTKAIHSEYVAVYDFLPAGIIVYINSRMLK